MKRDMTDIFMIVIRVLLLVIIMGVVIFIIMNSMIKSKTDKIIIHEECVNVDTTEYCMGFKAGYDWALGQFRAENKLIK